MDKYIEVKKLLVWLDEDLKEADEQQKKVLAKLVKRIIHETKIELVKQTKAEVKEKGGIQYCGNCKKIWNGGNYCSYCGARKR